MFARISIMSPSESESWVPFVYGGWCQYAITHCLSVAARSLRSQFAIGPVEDRLTFVPFSTMKWAFP